MNLQRYNLLKRYRATERITMGNFRHVVQIKNVVTTVIKCQNVHNAQLASLNARIAVLESALNLTPESPTDPSFRFRSVKRPEA